MPRTAKKDPNLQPGKPVKSANLSARAAIEWDRLTSELENAHIQVATSHRVVIARGHDCGRHRRRVGSGQS